VESGGGSSLDLKIFVHLPDFKSRIYGRLAIGLFEVSLFNYQKNEV